VAAAAVPALVAASMASRNLVVAAALRIVFAPCRANTLTAPARNL
jgi:hypothetical protein